MSKINILAHVVFGTKHRESTIEPKEAENLYRLIWSMLQQHNCYLCRINGMPEHIHMLIDLNPTILLSELVKEIKAKTSQWLSKVVDFLYFVVGRKVIMPLLFPFLTNLPS